MALPSQKTLELRLVVSADTAQGNLALQHLAAQAQRVEQAAGKAGRAIGAAGGGAAAGAGGGGVTGAAGAALGGLGALGGWLAAGAAVAATMSNLTAAVQGLNNPMLTAREQALGFARALPIVGGALADLIDNAMDAIDRIRDPETAARVDRARIEMPILTAQEQARFGARQKGQALFREVRGADNRFGAIRDTPTLDYADRVAMNRPGLLGAASSVALSGFGAVQDPRLRAAEDALQAARRGLDEAGRDAAGSASDVGFARRGAGPLAEAWRAAKARTEAERRIANGEDDANGDGPRMAAARAATVRAHAGIKGDLGDNFASRTLAGGAGVGAYLFPGGGGTKFSQLDAMNAEQMALQKHQNALLDLENKITANKEKQLTLLQKQAEVARAETTVMKTKLGLLDEEYAKVKGGGAAFVGLDKVEQRDFLDAAQRFKEGGRDNVTGDELGRLQGNPLTAGLVRDRLEKDAKNNGGLDELLKLTGARDEETVARERAKLKAELDLKVQIDEEQFAKLTAEKLKQLNLKELLGEIVKNQLEIDLRKPKLDSDRGRLERGG